jgi:hypothetical protein
MRSAFVFGRAMLLEPGVILSPCRKRLLAADAVPAVPAPPVPSFLSPLSVEGVMSAACIVMYCLF